jgi:outer membrane immunogenic protein
VVGDAAQTGLALQIKSGDRAGQRGLTRMRTITLAAAILLAGATAATAADLGRGSSTGSMKDAPGTSVSWEGAYAGAQAGYASFGASDVDGDGVIGGLNAGYDFQRGVLVFGPYASVNWSNAELTSESVVQKGIDWSVGGRAGVLVSPRILAYGKAGFTQTEYDIKGGGSDVMQGVEFGPGVEFSVAPGLFIGAEYLRREIHDGDVHEDLGLLTAKFKIGPVGR